MRPALLDSNVLFPSVLRDTLLTLAEHELVEPCWSDAILAEVTRALVDQTRAGPDAVARTISLMVAAFPTPTSPDGNSSQSGQSACDQVPR